MGKLEKRSRSGIACRIFHTVGMRGSKNHRACAVLEAAATTHPFGARTKTYDEKCAFFEDLQRLVGQKKTTDK